MATLAVFIALGGTGYATHLISGSNLVARSVTAGKLKVDTLTHREIKSGTIRPQELSLGALALMGKPGTPGLPGAAGGKGDTGERGEIGPTGPAGAKGDTGPAGADACDPDRPLLCPDADLPAGHALRVVTGDGVELTGFTRYRAECAIANNPDCLVTLVAPLPVPTFVRAWYQAAQQETQGAVHDAFAEFTDADGTVIEHRGYIAASPTALLEQSGDYQLTLKAADIIAP